MSNNKIIIRTFKKYHSTFILQIIPGLEGCEKTRFIRSVFTPSSPHPPKDTKEWVLKHIKFSVSWVGGWVGEEYLLSRVFFQREKSLFLNDTHINLC